MSIQRYDVDHDYGSAWMEPATTGDYVTYEDHRELLDKKNTVLQLILSLGPNDSATEWNHAFKQAAMVVDEGED